MAYCTEADVAEVVSNIADWAQNLDHKVTAATDEIDKQLRNVRRLTTEQIAALTLQSIADLKMAAIYWVLFLCYNDQSEGAAGGYADKAIDYKNWFDREMKSVNIETTVLSDKVPNGAAYGQEDISL